jgi:hypothetical protein
MRKISFSIWFYIASIIGLFFYSYTQVDLSLTLSRVSIYQIIEKNFQYIGYFNRPLSTYCYVGIMILLFVFYIRLLLLAAKAKLLRKTFWFVIIITAVILTFSYNAFSYDLFNNIFDAKIITHYHLNPYQHKALDFPGDPMLSFMHWVQRNYPYGPIWLLFSAPISFVGMNVFLPTFFLFKILAGVSYVGGVYYVEKIALQVNKKTAVFKALLFALNPLVLIEGLVSAHNDITMFFFAIFGLYLLFKSKNVLSGVSLLISIGIKFATIFLLPIFIFVYLMRFFKKKIHWEHVFLWTTLLMVPALIAVTIRTTFQPWYLLYLLPFGALVGNRFTIIPLIIASIFALTEYIPFLYTGNWNPPIPFILNIITFSGLLVSISSIFLIFFFKRAYKVVQ